MKFLLFLLLAVTTVLQAENIDMIISPDFPIEGQAFNLILASESPIIHQGEAPEIKDTKFVGATGGKQQSTGYYYLLLNYKARKAGDYIVPPIKVKIKGKVYQTKATTVKVWSEEFSCPKEKVIITKVRYNGKEKLPERVYPGVIFQIEYDVNVVMSWTNVSESHTHNDYIPRISPGGLNIIRQIIEKSSGNSMFRSFSRKSSWYGEKDSQIAIDELPYRTKTYNFKLAPVKSGEYTFKLTHNAAASQKVRGLPKRNFHKVPFSLEKTINVVPLPKPPADVKFLEIAGKWDVKAFVNKRKVKTGHTFELSVVVKGSGGDLQRIIAPELRIPGIEVDPKADISDTQGGKIIKYAMRALRPDAKFGEINFATFDPDSEKFVKHKVNPFITFTGSAIVSENPASESPSAGKALGGSPLKLGVSSIARPLFFNISPLWYLTAPLLPLIFLLLYYFSKRDIKTVDLQKVARKELFKLCDRLSSGEDMKSVEAELIPCLANCLNLPPGLTADELADRIEDRELAELLKNSSHDSFMPGQTVTKTDSGKLSRKLKALFMIGFIFLIPLRADDSPAVESYKAGNYSSAETLFEKLIEEDNANPNHYYNLGLTRMAQDKSSTALASFETALRLSPRDREIQKKVFELKDKLKIVNDSGLLAVRDQLRPDQWITTGLVIWSIVWLILIGQLIIKIPGKRWTALFGTVLSCLCLIACATQKNSTYRKGQYLAIEKTLTYENAGIAKKSPVELSPGQKIDILAKKGSWIRTSINDREIWIRERDLILFW